jgi:hypothetical protein
MCIFIGPLVPLVHSNCVIVVFSKVNKEQLTKKKYQTESPTSPTYFSEQSGRTVSLDDGRKDTKLLFFGSDTACPLIKFVTQTRGFRNRPIYLPVSHIYLRYHINVRTMSSFAESRKLNLPVSMQM